MTSSNQGGTANKTYIARKSMSSCTKSLSLESRLTLSQPRPQALSVAIFKMADAPAMTLAKADLTRILIGSCKASSDWSYLSSNIRSVFAGFSAAVIHGN